MRSTRAPGSNCCTDSSMRCVPRPTPRSAVLPQVGQAVHGGAPAAVMAAQGAVRLVEDSEGRTMRAVRQPAARLAGHDRGVAATVEEHQRLLALLQRRRERLLDRRCDARGVDRGAGIHQLDRRRNP